jgi:hypothetical protein
MTTGTGGKTTPSGNTVHPTSQDLTEPTHVDRLAQLGQLLLRGDLPEFCLKNGTLCLWDRFRSLFNLIKGGWCLEVVTVVILRRNGQFS